MSVLGACEILEFLLNGGKVSDKGFFEQADLYAVELLTTPPKLVALRFAKLIWSLYCVSFVAKK